MRKYLSSFCLASALPVGMLLAVTGTAAAQPAPLPPHLQATDNTDAIVRAYWTPERLRAAKPLDMRVRGAMHRGHATAVPPGARQIFQGGLPSVEYDGSLATQLWDESDVQNPAHVRPPLVGSGGLPFTTNRLLPQNDKVLYKVYPYATYGHLFFTEPSGDFQCSASIIRASTIATAGHCVNDGSTHYYTNWMFIPAANGSKAPFGTWTWSNATTTSAWYSGGGGVPNEQDDAVIILNQQKYKKVLHKIGDLTGYLGYEFNAALPTSVTQVGYPCNLDSCSDPVATYAQDTAGPTNNFQWGTASFGGASGGPEIQDFGQAPSGVPSETLGGNIVVSSTSYTYSAATEVDGGSIFYAPGQNSEYTFGDDINFACANGGC